MSYAPTSGPIGTDELLKLVGKSDRLRLMDNVFQNWFDTAVSDEQTTKQAKADLHDFLLKDVPVHGRLACCEIGFGGGRLLAQASSLYDAAYGIDIHNAFEKTREYLKKQGVHNAKLIDLEEAANLPEIDLFLFIDRDPTFFKFECARKLFGVNKSKVVQEWVAVLAYGKLETPIFGDYVEINPKKIPRS